MNKEYPIKRRVPRVKVEGKLKSKVRTIMDASLIDLSTMGAMIEHTQVLRPGTLCDLAMRWGEKELIVRAKVVWSSVIRSDKDEKGKDILIYRSGLEFYEPKKEQADFIASIVGSFLPGGSSPRDLGLLLGLF